MKPNWTAYLLLAAGAALIWWRTRADSQAGTPSVDWEGIQKTVSAFKPEGVDLNERTLADGIPAAASALSSLGMGGWLESPDGRLVLTSDKNLAASITAARTPILPSAPAAKKTTVTEYFYYPGPYGYMFWSSKKLPFAVLKTREVPAT